MVANSFFNDSFTLLSAVDAVDPLVLNETGIAWESDLNFLFQNPDNWKELRDKTNEHQFLYQSYPDPKYSPTFYEKNFLNEHFVVWMRAAAFDSFKKPYGMFPDGIQVGERPVSLTFNVSNVFNVDQFNGSKALSIHTRSSLGGASYQPVFAWLQVALGCVSVVSALALLLQEACCPRNIKKRAKQQSLKYSRDAFLEKSTTNEVDSSHKSPPSAESLGETGRAR